MAFAAFKIGELPVVRETEESPGVGKPCGATMLLLGDCCPFPGEVLAGLQSMKCFLVDAQSKSLKMQR